MLLGRGVRTRDVRKHEEEVSGPNLTRRTRRGEPGELGSREPPVHRLTVLNTVVAALKGRPSRFLAVLAGEKR